MFDSHILFFPVADLAHSYQFYHQILGLKLVLDQGGIQIYQVAPGAFVGLCQHEQGPLAADDRLIVTLVTPEVDHWYERLATGGVAVDAPPRENPRYQIYHFFARDPDGYRVEVQCFLHPFP
ncbi:MAG: VOC family protein [Chloroflexia bacterium]|jgi:catechol 2,3-dioxygenase-like lactoylglutathione lyase family enzyme|nr:VOC family protein [Chloroflexia bacterium]